MTKIGGLSKLEIIGKQPLSEKVYEIIKELIIDGDIEPGTRLTETQVAKQLGVSPTPVREAFRRLSSEGLVEIIPYKGVVVQSYSEEEILEAYQCREALEVMALKLSFDKLCDDEIGRLRECLELSENAETITELVELNSLIHNIILEKANNKKLKDLLESINDIIFHDRNMSAINMERREQIYDEHKELIEAIEKKNLEKAIETMVKHIWNGYNYILEQ